MNKDIATMKTIGYTKILNIDALSITEKQLLEMMDSQLESKSGNGVLVTPNLDHLVKLQRDKEFYDCYKKAQWVTCDSRILQLFSKLLNALSRKLYQEALSSLISMNIKNTT